MTPAQARAAADRAAAAFPAWSATGPNARRAILSRAAEAPEKRRDAFVKAMMDEIGATVGWAMFNLLLAGSMVRPRTHELIVEAFAEAGFPEGVVNVVTNAPADAGEVVGALIDHPALAPAAFQHRERPP